ncbi:AMP-binding protein [Actinosynnema sp. NPDC023587]|uniref:AMP-binding protein n=1 Tax=Actinosynnema sp. NPDC023587 TaxID=3154695 RepID=UPI0034090E75
MDQLRALLGELGVAESEISRDARIRAHLALDSTETVELQNRLAKRYGVAVDLWDTHDFTLGELSDRIRRALPVVRVPADRAAEYEREGLWGRQRVDELVLHPGLDEEALVAGDRRLTHAQLSDAVRAAAARLSALGIARGDRVVVQLPNDIELVVLTLALSRLGAPPILTPVSLRRLELEHLVRVAAPVAVAVPDKHARFDHLALARELGVRTILSTGADDVVDLVELCRPEPGYSSPVSTVDDVALCLLSSGTTGPPKVIPRSQQGYAYQLRQTPSIAGVDARSVYLAVMPVTHGFVLGCPGVLGTLAQGGKVVLGTSAEPEAAFELVERERVTHTTLVPALAERWAAVGTSRDLSSLEVVQVGGARPRRGQVAGLPDALGCRVQQCYGMSEGLLCYTALDDPDDIAFDTQGRPASPADEIRVVDGAGLLVRPGEVGELLTRGPYTIAGYYDDPAADAVCFTPDGFYRTGDLVRQTESGSLVVEGRTRDVINRGGEKIAAAELDLLAAEHPGVAAAAAVAAPHPRYGEEICLVIVPSGDARPDLVELRRFLAGRGLARYKLPERLETVDALPYVGIGKVDKKALRARVAE